MAPDKLQKLFRQYTSKSKISPIFPDQKLNRALKPPTYILIPLYIIKTLYKHGQKRI